MTNTSGKFRAQPARLMTELVTDPALRNNFEQTNKSLQFLHQQATGRNFFLSETVTTTSIASGPTKVTGLEGVISTTGRPVIIAIVPQKLDSDLIAGTSTPAGGSYLGIGWTSATAPLQVSANIDLQRDQEPIFRHKLGASVVAATNPRVDLPPCHFLGVDFVGAGK